MKCIGLLLAVLVAIGWPAEPASAVTADELIHEVLLGAKNDTERAGKLIQAARVVGDNPKVMTAMLERGLDYAVKAARTPEAMRAAFEAVDLLDRSDPERKDLWQDKRLELHRLQYRNAYGPAKILAAEGLLPALLDRAETQEDADRWADAAQLYYEAYPLATMLKSLRKDEIAQRRLRAMHFDRICQQAEALKKAVAADPTNNVAREKLIELLVVELDQPVSAGAFLDADIDQAWRTYVPMASTPPGELTEAAAQEVGRWTYKFLAPKASKYARQALLRKARACYERAIESHRDSDVAGLALRMVLQQIDADLAETLAGEPGNYVELLKHVDIAQDTLAGVWQLSKAGLSASRKGYCRLRLPVTVDGDYQLSIKFTKSLGRGDVAVAAPVGAAHAAVVVGAGDGTEAGLEPAGGQPLSANPTHVKMPPLGAGRAHQLDITVTAREGLATISADLDHKPVVRWRGKPTSVGLTRYWQPIATGSIVLRATYPDVTFSSVQVRRLSGKLDLARGEVNQAASQPGDTRDRFDTKVKTTSDGKDRSTSPRKLGKIKKRL